MTQSYICPACGYAGYPRRVTKGSILIELVLWLFFIVPGVLYSIWRLTSRYDACPKCGHSGMIPADSLVGQKILKDLTTK